MPEYTSLAILKDDHIKLKVISSKRRISMIQLLQCWINSGCQCADTNQTVQQMPATGQGSLSFKSISNFNSPRPVIAHNPPISHEPTTPPELALHPDLELLI